MNKKIIIKSFLTGLIAAIILLIFYFIILTLVSGFAFTRTEFTNYWYYIIVLSAGFGVQIGLYTYLKTAINAQDKSRKVVVVSTATSTVTMISCCSHYLVNILPVIGATGIITFVSQYQIQLFWVGIVVNLLGIAYMISKVINVKREVR